MDAKTPDAPELKLHFLDYWRIIRLRKTIILIVFLLIVITTTAFTLTWPKTYASWARIQVEKDIPIVSGIETKQTYSSYDPFWLQTEFEVIQSSSVLNDVVRKLNLNQKWASRYGVPELKIEETYPILKKHINVKQSRNTSLIEIWVYSEDKNEAPEIANAIADVYREHRVNIRKQAREEGVASLREQLEEKEAQTKLAKQSLDELRRTNNIADTDVSTLTSTLLNTETLRSLEATRLAARAEYDDEATLLASVANKDRAELRKSLSTIYPDVELTSLSEKLNAGEQQLASLLKEYTEETVEVKKARSLVELVESQLDKRIDGILTGIKTRTERFKARLDEAETQGLNERLNYNSLVTKYRGYFDAKRELENLQQVNEAIRRRIESETIETELPISSIVKVTDTAILNSNPVKPNIYFNIGFGMVVGLVVGVGLAFFIEYLDTSVKTIDDVERALQAPVVGVIPQNVGILLEEGPDTPHAEAYRVLRTNVLFSRKDDKFNTLSVLSAGAGEGKSTTLLNLATIFAQNGSRCLVVDSDLRRPSIHKVLKVSNSIGLTNYLLKQNSLEEVIQTTQLPTLDFMPSGRLPSSSMGILSSEKMKELIFELKRRYDFVFFDSPPLLGVSDASILASEMDMVLQVIQYRRYPQPMTLRAKQMVQKVGGNLLGIVLNNINMSQDENYYYYSGYYENSKQDADSGVKNSKSVKKSEVTKV